MNIVSRSQRAAGLAAYAFGMPDNGVRIIRPGLDLGTIPSFTPIAENIPGKTSIFFAMPDGSSVKLQILESLSSDQINQIISAYQSGALALPSVANVTPVGATFVSQANMPIPPNQVPMNSPLDAYGFTPGAPQIGPMSSALAPAAAPVASSTTPAPGIVSEIETWLATGNNKWYAIGAAAALGFMVMNMQKKGRR